MPSEIVIPAAIRVPLARLTFETVDRARTTAFDQGELRRRDRYTSVPQRVPVTWEGLTQAEFDAFWSWFESDLEVGARKFDLRLERQGGPGAGSNPRIEWWTAQFLRNETPRHEALTGGRYRISAGLLLTGEPFDDRVAPGIHVRGGIQFRGRVVTQPGRIRVAGAITFDGQWFTQPRPITAAGSITFSGVWKTNVTPADYRITPEGDTRATPEGDTRVHLDG